jgi:hypothetical protein
MNKTDIQLRTGDWVQVKDLWEIVETLDVEGTRDGLPFMPEMAEFCGRRLRVLRRAEKTCVEYAGINYKIREFRHNDVVLLDMPRCTGTGHDGCQRACNLFWKTAWLRKDEASRPARPSDLPEQQHLLSRLKTKTDSTHYFCQSTQLDNATLPLSRGQVLLKCLADVRSGSRGFFEMLRLMAIPIWRYYVTDRTPQPVLVSDLKRTPVGNLNLQAGEWVQIKSEPEIAETCDTRARNRGLTCDLGMRLSCGGTYQVRNRLDRMILEATGEMKQVESTVILDGINCLCWWNHVGGCPRNDFAYWREVWLKRIEQATEEREVAVAQQRQ